MKWRDFSLEIAEACIRGAPVWIERDGRWMEVKDETIIDPEDFHKYRWSLEDPCQKERAPWEEIRVSIEAIEKVLEKKAESASKEEIAIYSDLMKKDIENIKFCLNFLSKKSIQPEEG